MVLCRRSLFFKFGSFVPDTPKPLKTGEDSKKRSGIINIPERRKSTLPLHPKNSEAQRAIRTAIENNDFIKRIVSEDLMEEVIAAMYEKIVVPGEVIIRQGDRGGNIYVSAEGSYQTIVRGKLVDEFDDVRVFGELAILYNAERAATIKASTAGSLWVLGRDLYQQIRYRRNVREQQETMEFLSNNNILGEVGKDALQLVANLLKSEYYPSGTEIIKEGDEGHKFYIIRAGTVTITKMGEGVVGVFEKGASFGEYALLKEVRRQATVTANAPGVECLTLTRKEFTRYFVDAKEFKGWELAKRKSTVTAPEFDDLSLQDLVVRTTLGVGGFSVVKLVQHRQKKELCFALKCQSKSAIVDGNQQEHVRYERDIQKKCNTEFIVKLYRTFSDDMNIFFLMETCMGGDLFHHIKRKKARRFEDSEARFYFACVLEAIGYLHSKEIIYRDLKPENLLICPNGYLKLTDLGCAKEVRLQGKTSTFLGTPEYLAPEIINHNLYNKAVDFWQFGVLIFDLLCGFSPFKYPEGNSNRVYNNILNGIDRANFPSHMNIAPKHLIMKLCRPKPFERLGMDENGIEGIKKHKWFQGFNWSQFQQFKMPPPFKPKLKGPLDLRYIEKCTKKETFEGEKLNAIDAQWFNDWDT